MVILVVVVEVAVVAVVVVVVLVVVVIAYYISSSTLLSYQQQTALLANEYSSSIIRLSHMQMTDSDFTLNDWRRLGGGGAVLYYLGPLPSLIWGQIADLLGSDRRSDDLTLSSSKKRKMKINKSSPVKLKAFRIIRRGRAV